MEQTEEKKKRKGLIELILFLALSILIFIEIGRFCEDFCEVSLELKILISIGISLLILLILYLLKKFKIIKPTEKKELVKREALELLPTENLRNEIEKSQEIIEKSKKILDKRGDKKISETFGEQFNNIIIGGGIVFAIALIFFGSIPAYFGVNNEFINPSNNTLGINGSMNMVAGAFVTINEVGQESYIFWFWFFWVVVYVSFINPIMIVIGELLKKKYNWKDNYLDVFGLFGLGYFINLKFKQWKQKKKYNNLKKI